MGWQQVQRRGFRNRVDKWHVFPLGRKQGIQEKEVEVSSFYFSHFPGRIGVGDIFRLFGCIEEVTEVIISPRRN